MNRKPGRPRTASTKTIKDIRRATRKHYSAEEKIRIVLDGPLIDQGLAMDNPPLPFCTAIAGAPCCLVLTTSKTMDTSFL